MWHRNAQLALISPTICIINPFVYTKHRPITYLLHLALMQLALDEDRLFILRTARCSAQMRFIICGVQPGSKHNILRDAFSCVCVCTTRRRLRGTGLLKWLTLKRRACPREGHSPPPVIPFVSALDLQLHRPRLQKSSGGASAGDPALLDAASLLLFCSPRIIYLISQGGR